MHKQNTCNNTFDTDLSIDMLIKYIAHFQIPKNFLKEIQ